MAEGDSQEDLEKTEDPTPHRIEQAFKQGRTFYSREVTSFLMLLALTLTIAILGPDLFRKSFFLKHYIENSYDLEITTGNLRPIMYSLASKSLLIIILPIAFTLIVALFSSFIQTGRFLISSEFITPNLEKISILKGFHRIFSVKAFIEFLKGIVKVSAIIITVYLITKNDLLQIHIIHSFDILGINSYITQLVIKSLISVCVLMGLIAILDYVYQRFSFYNQLKMSKYELKQEYKEIEGSPEVKAKLKQLRAEKAKRRMMAAVPTADVVITNPTHFAVALKYERSKMNAPIVVAKGIDHIALKIRKIAFQNEVTIIENPPLARALYSSTEIDDEIPLEHYKAVAEIINYVYKIKRNKSKS